MVISYFKLAIQTCPFTAIKHPWKSSICVYISIEHIFQNIVNSCYVTWRVDLFWRWKTPPNTTKKYSFSHCCRVRECSTIISFIFWKGERGISCVRCIVLLFDIARSFDALIAHDARIPVPRNRTSTWPTLQVDDHQFPLRFVTRQLGMRRP